MEFCFRDRDNKSQLLGHLNGIVGTPSIEEVYFSSRFHISFGTLGHLLNIFSLIIGYNIDTEFHKRVPYKLVHHSVKMS